MFSWYYRTDVIVAFYYMQIDTPA